MGECRGESPPVSHGDVADALEEKIREEPV